MTAARQDITVEQGANFRFVVEVVGGPEDLEGYTAAMQVRIIKDDPVALMDVPPGDITVNHLTRQVVIDVPGSETLEYDWDYGVYDVVLSGAGGTWRLAEGRAILSRTVTR